MTVRMRVSQSSSKSWGRILSILAIHRPPCLQVSSSQAGATSFLKIEKSTTPSLEGRLMLLKSRQKSSTESKEATFICEFCQSSFAEWLCSSTHRHHVDCKGCFCAVGVLVRSTSAASWPDSGPPEPEAVEAVTPPAAQLEEDRASSSSTSFSASRPWTLTTSAAMRTCSERACSACEMQPCVAAARPPMRARLHAAVHTRSHTHGPARGHAAG
mmetsp:Transcript_144935/g.251554  ORF Transcript_144935/g.251554 Transcript_144935/m.251554 type:complete len:214 (+) Transcript_144935:388-1029(+)